MLHKGVKRNYLGGVTIQTQQQNRKKFQQNFNKFLTATDYSEKTDEIKTAMLLNMVGEEPVEIFNTFDLRKQEKKFHQN